MRQSFLVRLGLAFACTALLAACNTTVRQFSAVTISVSPATDSVVVSQTAQLSATVGGTADLRVAWTVTEGTLGGSVSATGLYTAPVASGTFHVVATSVADPTKSATAELTVTLAPPTVNTITVSPPMATLPFGGTQQFSARVNSVNSGFVTWAVGAGGAGGTILQNGLYTAPRAGGTDTITATSTVDTTKSATATVTITVPGAPTISYSPAKLVCTKGVTCALAATVATGGLGTTFSASPALPAGLVFSSSNGNISGAATSLSTDAAFTVTATNSAGTATTTLHVSVVDVAPANLIYVNQLICTVGVQCAVDAPDHQGGAILAFTITPALPAGLVLNTASGAVSGKPAAVAQTANYIVTAENSGGTTFAILAITVNDAAPANLVYSPATLVCTRTLPCNIAAPVYSGGVAQSFTVSPALPAGLSSDAATGAISGTPSFITAGANYVITASNSGGSTLVDLNITVNDLPPTTLSYPATVLVCSKGISCSLAAPTQLGGTILSYAIAPALPLGLSIDRTTGIISGVPTVVSAPSSYVITGTNTGGSTTETITVEVKNAAAKLAFVQQPSGGQANSVLPQTSVAIQDASGATVTNASGAITLTISSGTLGGTTTVAAVNGVAAFNTLTVSAAGTYTLTATSTGLTAATSNSFTVSAGKPTHLVFTLQPLDAQSGIAFTRAVTVSILDASNNLVASNAQVALTASGGNLSGGLGTPAASGVATFNLSLIAPVGSYTLAATSAGLTGATSASFTITAGDASMVAFIAQPPSAAQSGIGFGQSVTVQVQDSAGNPVSSSAAPITITGGSATVANGGPVAAVNGLATFPRLALSGAAGSYTLVAASGTLSQGVSSAVSLSIAPAIKLAFLVQPSDSAPGYAILPGIQVAAVDKAGQVVRSANPTVTIGLNDNPGVGAHLSGTLSQTAVNGIATFSDLKIDKQGIGFTLSATADTGSALTSTVSQPFNGASLINGNFEAGISGWTNANGCAAAATGNTVHSGVASLNSTASNTNGCPIAQVALINVAATTSLRVRADVRLLDAAESLTMTLRTGSEPNYDQNVIGTHTFNFGALAESSALAGTTTVPGPTWYSFTTADLKPLLSGATAIRITFSGPAGKSNVRVDNVKLVVGDSSVPVVSAAVSVTNGSFPLQVTLAGTATPGSSTITATTWDFGDANHSSANTATASVTYGVQGTYYASFSAQDVLGAASTVFLPIVATDALTSLITATPTPAAGPAPLAVSFDDSGSADTASNFVYAWNFGDGTTSNVRTPPAHTYNNPGSYLVTLTVTDAFSVAVTNSYTVIATGATALVNGNFEAGLMGWTNGRGCATAATANAVHVGVASIASTGNTAAGSGTGACPISQTALIGVDQLASLRIRADLRLLDPAQTASLIITTGTAPTYDQTVVGAHTFSITSGAFTQSSALSGATVLPGDSWYSFTSDDLKSALSGATAVRIVFTGPAGTSNARIDNVKLVIGDTTLPTVTASVASNDGNFPEVVNFNGAATTGSANVTASSWDFDDAARNSSTALRPSNTYVVQGNYQASFSVEDALGGAATAFVPVTVVDHVSAAISTSPAPAVGVVPFAVSFDDTGTASTGANPLAYAWDFGDGLTSNVRAPPAHTYNAAGTYLVTLTVTDQYSDSATSVYAVVVTDPAHLVSNSGFDTGLTGWTNFQQCATISTGNSVHGSVASLSSTSSNLLGCPISQIAAVNVAAQASVRVRADVRLLDAAQSMTMTITTGSAPTYDSQVVGTHTFNMGALSESSALAATTTIPGNTWYSFTTADLKPLLTGATAFRITFTGPPGKSNVRVDNVFVVTGDSAVPVPSASIASTTGAFPLTVNFTGSATSSSSTIASMSWDFGDANRSSSTSATPQFTYSTPGTFYASYSAVDALGAAATSFVTVTVTDALTAVIAVSPDPATGSAPFTVQFSDSGTVSTAQNTLTYSWSFGDGSALNTTRAPSHTYATQGSFLVTLTVTDAYAQTASTSYTVIVNGSN
jgi:PKD repeat protein